MHPFSACLLSLAALLYAYPAAAQKPFYAELQLLAGGVSHSELDFYPVSVSVSAGAYVLPGIGVEVSADTGVSPSEKDDFEVAVTQATGLALRLESPPADGLSGYVLLGYVAYSVDQQNTRIANSRTLSEDFTGPRFSVGLVQRLSRLPNFLVSAEYRNYYIDESIQIDGISLGLRFNIQ